MFIWTQFIDQLPVGLLAQLVERCTGIAEVMGSNPVRAWNLKIFFRSYLQLLVSVAFFFLMAQKDIISIRKTRNYAKHFKDFIKCSHCLCWS